MQEVTDDFALDPAVARRKALGDAIATARFQEQDLSRAELGERLGGVSERTVARWENGSVDLTLEQVISIEEALELARGTLAGRSGYFTFEAEPYCDEPVVQTRYFSGDLGQGVSEALEALDLLGFGIRLRNQHRVLREEADGVGTSTLEWVMDVMLDPPELGGA